MAHISGKAGQVMLATAGVTGIKSWTLDYTADMLETTDFADAGVKSYVVGGSGWSGSFEGLKNTTPIALATSDTPIDAEFQEIASVATGRVAKWTGGIFITGVSASTANDGIVTYSYTFQGTGALLPPTS